MSDLQRRYKSAIQLNNDLKKVLQKNAIEIKRLRQLVRVQHLNDNIDKVDLIHNIKNYLEAELVIDLSAKTRLQPYVKGRCMFYWFAKRYTDLTLKDGQWANGGPYRAVAELNPQFWEFSTLPWNNGLTILRKKYSNLYAQR